MDPSINICFSTTDSWASGVIRWGTRSTVSHALVTYRSSTLGRVMVMEAVGRGFVMLPWRSWRQRNKLVARFAVRVPVAQQLAALHQVTTSLGAEYDSLSLLGFIFRRWRKRARNPLDNAGKLICSEVVAKLLKLAGLGGFEDPGQWTPADLLQAALSRPDDFQLLEADLAALPQATPLLNSENSPDR